MPWTKTGTLSPLGDLLDGGVVKLEKLPDDVRTTNAARPVGKGETVIRVNDYPTVQDALNAAPAGARVLFQGVYDASVAPFVVQQDRTWIDALGASFTTATWGRPIFDAVGRDGCTFDLGVCEFTGARGGVGTSYRGSSAYVSGCAVWLNGDGNHVRNCHAINLPGGAVFFSSWATTGTYDRKGVGNKVGVAGTVEVEGYDFGVLWSWQDDLMIANLTGHDDIDDSVGVNPTHVYYGSSDATYRSTGVQIHNVRAVRHLYGQPFQIKFSDQAVLDAHTADDSRGLINVLSCDDLQVGLLLGTRCRANDGQGAVTMTTGSRPRLDSVSVQLAAGVNERAISIWMDDAEIGRLVVETAHGAGLNTNLNTIVLRGNRGRVKSSTIRSRGTEHMRGIACGLGSDTVTRWVIDDPVGEGVRAVVDVLAGSTAVKVRHDPRVHTLTGTGTPVLVTGTPVGGELILETAVPAQAGLSTFGDDPSVAMLAAATPTIGAANSAIQVLVTPKRDTLVTKLRWFAVTQSGNYDIGIVDDANNAVLWRKGSTAWPAAGVVDETLPTAVTLYAGRAYRLVLAADNATATYRGAQASAFDMGLRLDGLFASYVVGSAFPLPSTTLARGTTGSTRVPLIICREA